MSRALFITVDIDADPDTVFNALATSDGLASFWTPNVSGTPEQGATLEFGFEPAPVDLQIRVEQLAPGRLVAWSCPGPWPGWEGTTIRWALGESPDADTRVVLSHGGWTDDTPDADLGSVTFTWALVCEALKRYTETGNPDPALR
jgi:uncharacterized protein YndB with AHSA1/START domain